MRRAAVLAPFAVVAVLFTSADEGRSRPPFDDDPVVRGCVCDPHTGPLAAETARLAAQIAANEREVAALRAEVKAAQAEIDKIAAALAKSMPAAHGGCEPLKRGADTSPRLDR